MNLWGFLFSVFLISVSAYARGPIFLNSANITSVDGAKTFSSAHAFQEKYYFVTNQDDSYIYELYNDRVDAVPYIDLNSYENTYSYLKSIPNNRFQFSGVSYCPISQKRRSSSFFLVHHNGNHILEAKVVDKVLLAQKYNANGFEEYFDHNRNLQTRSIAIDCTRMTAYLALENFPNTILVAAYAEKGDRQWTIVDRIHMENGDSPLQESVTDLQYVDGKLYILQKNQSAIIAIDVDHPENIVSYSFEPIRQKYTKEKHHLPLENSLAVKSAQDVRLFVNSDEKSSQNDSLAVDIQLPQM